MQSFKFNVCNILISYIFINTTLHCRTDLNSKQPTQSLGNPSKGFTSHKREKIYQKRKGLEIYFLKKKLQSAKYQLIICFPFSHKEVRTHLRPQFSKIIAFFYISTYYYY